MTAAEIRMNAPPMAIWMADAAIREARRAITGNIPPWGERLTLAPYNRPEVEIAGRVLFRMFHACESHIRMALITMPEKMDGGPSRKNYFDEFVESLDCRLRKFASKNPTCLIDDPDWPKEAELRKSDWILEKC